jgi:hypothetical protein
MRTLVHRFAACLFVVPLSLFLPGGPAAADEARLAFGGDQYAAGEVGAFAAPVEHDAFIIGNDVTVSAPVPGDAHLAGFDVNAMGDVGGDIYAAGFSVSVTGAVGGDVTSGGSTVSLRSAKPVAGNVRLAGGEVTIATPIGGSALVTARSLMLDAAITGDFSFYGEKLSFGPNASVAGRLDIRSPAEIAVPASVASADRVHFERLASPDYMSEAGKTAGTVASRFWPMFWSAIGGWLLLSLAGAALIAFLPGPTRALEVASETRPWRNLGLGILGFAAVIGLVPVVAMTVVGLIVLPLLLILVVIACGLAYVTGAFLIGLRFAKAFMPIDSNLKRLAVMIVSLVAAPLVGMIPLAGWLVTLAILVFGFGTVTVLLMVGWTRRDAARLAPLTEAAAGPAPAAG